MIQSSSTETVDACQAAAQRGVAWLLDQQTAAGSWRQLEAEVFDAYYKGGWALAVSGQPAAAHRLLTHVQRAFLTADGRLEPRAALLHTDIARLYASSYAILAAQKLDRYEIAAPAVRYLLSQQDPDHGGFYSGKTPAGGKRRSDSMSTAMSGVALLAAGQTERAALAGDCLLRMVEMQPAPDRFFTTLDETGRLQVAFPPEAAVWRVVEAGQTGQRWFAVGLPFAFAVLLHAGDRRAAVQAAGRRAVRFPVARPGAVGRALQREGGLGLQHALPQHRGGRLSRHRPARRAADHGLPDVGRLVHAWPGTGAWGRRTGGLRPLHL